MNYHENILVHEECLLWNDKAHANEKSKNFLPKRFQIANGIFVNLISLLEKIQDTKFIFKDVLSEELCVLKKNASDAFFIWSEDFHLYIEGIHMKCIRHLENQLM
jgi:hypothetical protein